MINSTKLINKYQNLLKEKGIDDIIISYQKNESGGCFITKQHGKIQIYTLKKLLTGVALKYINYYDNIIDEKNYKLKQSISKLIRSKLNSVNGKKVQLKYGNGIFLIEWVKNNQHPMSGKKRADDIWNKGLTKNDDDRILQHSIRMKNCNPVNKMTDQQLKQSHEKISNSIKKKIKSGEYKPQLNCWNNSIVEWNNRQYRSSWETFFHYLNPNCEYEKLRIEYYDSMQNKNRIYIVDFIDYVNKTVYEIKPKNITKNQNEKDKFKSLKDWCSEHNYKMKIITEEYFKSNLVKKDLVNFTEDLQKKISWIL